MLLTVPEAGLVPYKSEENQFHPMLFSNGGSKGNEQCDSLSEIKLYYIGKRFINVVYMLSTDKSAVLHYGQESKCKLPCPTLKVHKENMHI